MKVLLFGGTGQTGPLVLQGLLDRGAEVTIFHSGQHEPPLPPVEHIHGDAHFADPIRNALGSRTFDVVIAMYGRTKVIAKEMVGRTERFISVSGTQYYYASPLDPAWGAFGVVTANEESPFSSDIDIDKLGVRVRETEQAIMAHHFAGHFEVTIMRYPSVYGPNAILPSDWSFVRRLLDKRPYLLLPDGGLMLRTRVYRDNAAHALLLAFDKPEAASGQIYNVSDEPPEVSLGQRIMRMAKTIGHDCEFVDVPAWLGERLYGKKVGFHHILETAKIRKELGYRDVVPLVDAIDVTTAWWLANRPEPGGEVERKLGDRFDYAAEDEIIRLLHDVGRRIDALPLQPAQTAHPFRHPRSEGEAWSEGTARGLLNYRSVYPIPLWSP